MQPRIYEFTWFCLDWLESTLKEISPDFSPVDHLHLTYLLLAPFKYEESSRNSS